MYEFKSELIQADWLAFRAKIDTPLAEKVKPILRQPQTSDIVAMMTKNAFIAGWLPWILQKKADAHYFLKIARVEALKACPYGSPELKVKIWVEAEIAEIERVYDELDAISRGMITGSNLLQSNIKAELELKNMSGRETNG